MDITRRRLFEIGSAATATALFGTQAAEGAAPVPATTKEQITQFTISEGALRYYGQEFFDRVNSGITEPIVYLDTSMFAEIEGIIEATKNADGRPTIYPGCDYAALPPIALSSLKKAAASLIEQYPMLSESMQFYPTDTKPPLGDIDRFVEYNASLKSHRYGYFAAKTKGRHSIVLIPGPDYTWQEIRSMAYIKLDLMKDDFQISNLDIAKAIVEHESKHANTVNGATFAALTKQGGGCELAAYVLGMEMQADDAITTPARALFAALRSQGLLQPFLPGQIKDGAFNDHATALTFDLTGLPPLEIAKINAVAGSIARYVLGLSVREMNLSNEQLDAMGIYSDMAKLLQENPPDTITLADIGHTLQGVELYPDLKGAFYNHPDRFYFHAKGIVASRILEGEQPLVHFALGQFVKGFEYLVKPEVIAKQAIVTDEIVPFVLTHREQIVAAAHTLQGQAQSPAMTQCTRRFERITGGPAADNI